MIRIIQSPKPLVLFETGTLNKRKMYKFYWKYFHFVFGHTSCQSEMHLLFFPPQGQKRDSTKTNTSDLKLRTCCSRTHLPYSPAAATSRLHPAPLRVQVRRRARRECKHVFLRCVADIPQLPLQPPPPLTKTQFICFILTPSSASLRRPSLQNRREASSWRDGDQVSCRRLERSVFMAAAGRDVSLAPSIQLPSDGFSPCFITIPIISRGGGPRPPSPLSPPARSVPHTRHSSRHMQYELKHACSKNIYRHQGPPLYDTMQVCFLSPPSKKYESRRRGG